MPQIVHPSMTSPDGVWLCSAGMQFGHDAWLHLACLQAEQEHGDVDAKVVIPDIRLSYMPVLERTNLLVISGCTVTPVHVARCIRECSVPHADNPVLY